MATILPHVCVVILLIFTSTSASGNYQSRKSLSSKRAFEDGDYIIGGIFPIHTGINQNNTACTKFNPKGMSWTLAMIYAIKEINKDPKILPGIKLGYDIRDGCNQVDRAIEASLDFALGPNGEFQSTGMYVPDNVTSGKIDIPPKRPCCDWRLANHAGSKVVGVVGSASSKISMAVATVFGAMNIPQISYSSTSRLLSDKSKYRSFLRTIPSDVLQVQALADIVENFHWQYVSTVASDDIYGKIGIEAFKQAIKTREICIAVDSVFSKSSSEGIKADIQKIVTRLRTTEDGQKANVVVLFCSNHEAIQFLQEAAEQGLTGKTWIASESWGDEAEILKIDPDVVAGTLGLVPEIGNTTGYANYVNQLTINELSALSPWVEELMRHSHNCSLEGAFLESSMKKRSVIDSPVGGSDDGLSTLLFTRALPEEYIHCSAIYDYNTNPMVSLGKNETFLPLGKTPYVIDAVKAHALALESLCKANSTSCEKNAQIDEKKFLDIIKDIEFQGLQGLIKFDKNGDPSGSYRVNNIQRQPNGELRYVSVGSWDGRRERRKLQIKANTIVWNDKSKKVPDSLCSWSCSPGFRVIYGSTTCCWKCVSCERGEHSNRTNSDECYKCDKGRTNNSDHTECIEKPLEYLAWNDPMAIIAVVASIVLLGIALFVLMIFIIYRDTPVVKGSNRTLSYVLITAIALCYVLPFLYIGEPTDRICIIQPVYSGFVFTLCVAIMLTKTERLLVIFNAKFSKVLALRRSKFKHEHRQALFVSGLTLMALIIGIVCTVIWTPGARYEHDLYEDKVVVHCGEDWLTVQITCMLYVFVLSLICSFLAFKARKLPENFNEAKHLSFSMFMLCLVWIVSLAAYFGSNGKTQTVIITFAVIIAALFLMAFMFFPKIRIILFQSEKNDPDYVRSQTIHHTMGSEIGSTMRGDDSKRRLSNVSAHLTRRGSTPRPSPKASPRPGPMPRGRLVEHNPCKDRAASISRMTPSSTGSPQLFHRGSVRRHSDTSAKSGTSCSSFTNLCVTHGKDGATKPSTKSGDVVCTKL